MLSLVISFLLMFNTAFGVDEPVYVDSVVNKIQIGPLTGNTNLAFGVKNILEEIIQDKTDLASDIDDETLVLKTEIVYFDILTTNTNIAVFHKNETEVVIRIYGTLYKGKKKIKKFLAEEASSEISTSTLIVNEGGDFNQQSARNAMKKACETLINKLLE